MSELIDRWAFIADMNDRIKEAHKWCDETPSEEIKIRAEQAIATFCEASLTAKKMPTIEAVKHGEWIGWCFDKCVDYETEKTKRCYGYRCSNCHRNTAVKTNYCPNCGARMIGKEKDDG